MHPARHASSALLLAAPAVLVAAVAFMAWGDHAQALSTQQADATPPRQAPKATGDRSTITIRALQSEVIEGSSVVFTLSRTDDTSEALTVTVRIDDPEMLRCSDYDTWFTPSWPTSCFEGVTFEQAVTFRTGASTASVLVDIPDDRRVTPDDAAVTVTVIDKDGYLLGDPISASVTVVDNDYVSMLVLGASHDEIAEGETETLTFTVSRLSGVEDYGEHVPWRLSSPSTGAPDETGVAEMAPGVAQFTKTVELPADNDAAESDGNYTFSIDDTEWVLGVLPLELEQEYFTIAGPRSITVAVRDAGGPRVSIEADQTGITEGEAATFTLTRPGDVSDVGAVNVFVEDPGHFMRGNHGWSDPQPPTTVEFAAGSATATLSLPTRDDWRDTADNDLTVTIEPGNSHSRRVLGRADLHHFCRDRPAVALLLAPVPRRRRARRLAHSGDPRERPVRHRPGLGFEHGHSPRHRPRADPADQTPGGPARRSRRC